MRLMRDEVMVVWSSVLGYSEDPLLRALGIHVRVLVPDLRPLLAGVRVLLVGVQVDPLSEPLHTDETKVRLLPTVDQLMPLQLWWGREALVTKLTRVLFLKLFFQQGQLLQSWGRLGHFTTLVSFVSLLIFWFLSLTYIWLKDCWWLGGRKVVQPEEPGQASLISSRLGIGSSGWIFLMWIFKLSACVCDLWQ